MIYLYRKKYFKEYFHHGIENKEKVLEYIIYRALKKSHDNLGSLIDLYEIPNEKQLEEWIKESKRTYKQFHRFIVIPDNPENLTYKLDDENEEISKIVNNKIKDLIVQDNVKEYKVGYLFTREKEGEFINEEREYGFSNQQVGWPCIIYEFLEELEQLENKNQDLYNLKWIKVRIIRAINREPLNKEELRDLLEICQANEKEITNLKRILEGQEHQDR